MLDARLAARARLVTWPAGEPFVRGFSLAYGPLGFNPLATSRRFRPVYDTGVVVPTAYGAKSEDIALAETVLRRTATVGDRVLHVTELSGLGLVVVRFRHDLELVQLNGLGLRKLKLSRADMIDTGAEAYPLTAEVAQILYDAQPSAHGIIWTSHQCDDGPAFILWGTRLDPGAAEILSGPVALSSAPGIRLVARAAEACGVLLEL